MRLAAVGLLLLGRIGPALTIPTAPEPTPGPTLVELDQRATSCTFSGSNGASSAEASKTACSTIVLSSVAVPPGVTLDLTGLQSGTQVVFEGETTFGYKEWSGPLVSVSGSHITVSGASGAYLNGDGSRWWDGQGSNGGKTKPKFFYAHGLSSSSITGIRIQNSPVQVFSIDSSTDLTLTDITIDNTAGDSAGAHNTDGFDIGDSTGITVTGANVANQDDCVAVNSGKSITVQNSICSGGHGLSIGSVGGRSDNTVDGVTFSNNEVKNSVNGIRIKATEGDTGSISGVTYTGITLQSISGYGILIEQNYKGGDLEGTATSGIPITNLTIEHVVGSGAVSSSGYDVVVTCGPNACSGWTWSDVTVTGGKKYTSCTNVPAGIACS